MPTITSRTEWGARQPTNRTMVPREKRRAFVIHYDDGKPTIRTGPDVPRSIQRFHQQDRGWADIGYNFVIDQGGAIFEGRGWDVLGAHAGPGGNAEGIGVQVHIGGDQQPSAAAVESLRWLHETANQRFGRTLTLKGHRDYMSTSCPGEPLYRLVKAGLTKPTPKPAPQSQGGSVRTNTGREHGLVEHFVTGRATVRGDWVLGVGVRDTGTSNIIKDALHGLYVRRKFDHNTPAIAGRSLTRKDLINLRDFAHCEGIEWKGGLTWPLCKALAKPARYLDVRWFNGGNAIDVRYGEMALFLAGCMDWGWWLYDGKHGSKTGEAVRRFQTKLGNRADGKLGPKQWAELARRSGIFRAPGMSSGGASAVSGGGRVSSPVPGRGIGTPYGRRGRHWSTRRDWRGWGIHTGDDYPAPVGTPVVAVRGGTVSVFWGGSLGNVAVLHADNGRFYWYCHLQTGSRHVGRVKAGQTIGRVGMTGNTTGPHLHFEDNPSPRSWGNPRKPRW